MIWKIRYLEDEAIVADVVVSADDPQTAVSLAGQHLLDTSLTGEEIVRFHVEAIESPGPVHMVRFPDESGE